MGKFYWLSVVTVFGLGLFAIWYVADQRQNEILLQPQTYESDQAVINALAPFLNLQATDRKFIFIGIELENPQHMQLTQNLIASAKLKGTAKIAVDIFLEKALTFKVDYLFNFQMKRDSLVEWLKEMADAHFAIILAPNIYFSQIPAESLMNTSPGLKELKGVQVITITSYPETPEEFSKFFLPCSESQQIQTALSDMGCYVRRQSQLRTLPVKYPSTPRGFLLRLNENELVFFLN